MNLFRRFGVIMAGGLLAVTAMEMLPVVQAQTIPNLVVDPAGICPRREDLVRINPALDEGSVGGLVNRIATPSRSGVRLYPSQALSGTPTQAPPLTFDDEVEVLIGTPLGQAGGGPALVQRLREPVCGWLDVADLERVAQPMRVGPTSPDPE